MFPFFKVLYSDCCGVLYVVTVQVYSMVFILSQDEENLLHAFIKFFMSSIASSILILYFVYTFSQVGYSGYSKKGKLVNISYLLGITVFIAHMYV